MNFDTLLYEYGERRKEIGESADSTVRRYKRHVRTWREWLAEERDKSLRDVETVDLQLYISDKKRSGMAASTIQQRVSAISKFYQDMSALTARFELEPFPDNPYDALEDDEKNVLNGDSKKKAALDDETDDKFFYLKPDEVQALIENVPAPRERNELIIRLLFNVGFRREELAKCKLSNVDRDDNSIFIPPIKGDDGRWVAYDDTFVGTNLTAWLDLGGRDSMTGAADSDYLLPTNHTEHISAKQLNDVVKAAAENAGLQDTIAEYSDGRNIHKVTAHTLRHSFAMQAVRSGIEVRTIQTLMGHEDIETTQIYLQQSKDEAKEASRSFNPTSSA